MIMVADTPTCKPDVARIRCVPRRTPTRVQGSAQTISFCQLAIKQLLGCFQGLRCTMEVFSPPDFGDERTLAHWGQRIRYFVVKKVLLRHKREEDFF